MKQAKHIAIVVLAVLSLVVVLQNTAAVETQLLFVTLTMPRAVLLFITLLIGFVTGVFVSVAFLKRRSRGKQSTDA
jgi:uncharacterized integral membrane protein